MLKRRIIPFLSFNGFALVKTKRFRSPRMVGNPTQAARVYNARGVDELILCDILASKQGRVPPIMMLKEILKECFMPVGVGGGINTIQQISDLLSVGADKVIIKSLALSNPDVLEESVRIFGSQCICVAIDVKQINLKYCIYHEGAHQITLDDFIKRMEDAGVGEYMITSTEHDGVMAGFDLELAKQARVLTRKPIIFSGGAGTPHHFVDLFKMAEVDAVAAASIFHFTQYTPLDIKKELNKHGVPVRLPADTDRR